MRFLILVLLLVVGQAVPAFSGETSSPVTKSHLLMIESLLRDNQLNKASVTLDGGGRVLLKGEYKDSREVALAFSLAQSVVGVKWTSPVSPENVKVREWAQNLAGLFPTKKAAEPARASRKVGSGSKYALVVGVSRFGNDARGKFSLKYAADDAKSVAEYLIKYRKYRRADVTLLVDENATRKRIKSALDSLLEQTGEGDEVFIYFSSHGSAIHDGSLDVVTYDSTFKSPFTLSQTSFPSKDVRNFLQRTRSDNVYVIFDVCYSGAAFKGIEGFYYAGSKSISFDDDNQGFSKAAMAKTLLGAKDIVLEGEEEVGDAGRTAGARVIMSASDAGEKSYESDSIKASFFTHHLLQELRSGKDLKTAFSDSKPRVTADVKTEKAADQNPQVISSRKDWGR